GDGPLARRVADRLGVSVAYGRAEDLAVPGPEDAAAPNHDAASRGAGRGERSRSPGGLGHTPDASLGGEVEIVLVRGEAERIAAAAPGQQGDPREGDSVRGP